MYLFITFYDFNLININFIIKLRIIISIYIIHIPLEYVLSYIKYITINSYLIHVPTYFNLILLHM